MIKVLPLDQRAAQAGAYVRSCREAAGLSIEDAAAMVSRNAGSAKLHGFTIGMVEAGRILPTADYLARLSAVIPLDRRRFRALAAPTVTARLH